MSGEVMRELALFAGAGGGILGGSLLGWRTVCAVEINDYAAGILVARQNDGHLPPFPVWDDVTTFDGRPWRGAVDVVSGGFPCQDISSAGKGAGITGKQSGLWREMARIIGEVRPRYVFVENSPMLIHRGLTTVLRDLASLGYDARWGVLGARDVGAPHRRDRMWIVASDAHSDGERNGSLYAKASSASKSLGNATSEGLEKRESQFDDAAKKQSTIIRPDWWDAEPELGRVAHGVAHRMDRLAATGNGQVPSVAALAWAKLGR